MSQCVFEHVWRSRIYKIACKNWAFQSTMHHGFQRFSFKSNLATESPGYTLLIRLYYIGFFMPAYERVNFIQLGVLKTKQI